MPAEYLVTKKVLANHLNVSTRTIDKWMHDGVIPFIKMPGGAKRGTVRFDVKSVMKAIEKFTVEAL